MIENWQTLRRLLLWVRRMKWRLLGINAASTATIFERVRILNPKRVFMAPGSGIGPDCYIKCVPGELHLAEQASLGEGCWVSCTARVQIERLALIGPGCHITDANHTFAGSQAIKEQGRAAVPVVIGEGAWVGAGVKVLAGVYVGRGAVVGAGAVVTKDVPDFSIVAGAPARVIGSRTEIPVAATA
jgi:acetyltransferase-like isoleucine patch superfamily enzyme